jgi:hypothetical protein
MAIGIKSILDYCIVIAKETKYCRAPDKLRIYGF